MKRVCRPVTCVERNQMRALAREGLSVTAIAARQGRAAATIWQNCRDIFSALAEQRRWARQALRDRVIELNTQGLSAEQIADRLSLTRAAVIGLAGGKLRKGRQSDPARARRLLQAVDAAERGCRAEIAGRFGLPSVAALNYSVYIARKRLEAHA